MSSSLHSVAMGTPARPTHAARRTPLWVSLVFMAFGLALSSSSHLHFQIPGAGLAMLSVWLSWRSQARLARAHAEANMGDADWQAFVSACHDSVLVLRPRHDLMGRAMGYEILQDNVAARQLLGTGPDSLQGQWLHQHLSADAHPQLHQCLQSALDTRRAHHAEQPPHPVTGEDSATQRWLHHQVIPLRHGLLLLSRDTTEVHQSLHALRQQEAFYRSMVDSLPMAVFARSMRVHNAGEFIVWNRQAETVMQLKAAQVLGKRADAVLPEEVLRRSALQDQAVVRSGTMQRFAHLTYPTPAGERIVDMHKAPVYGVDGQLDHILSIAIDVTEQQRAAEQLRLASRVMGQTGDAVVVSDALDRVIMVNPAFLTLSGLQEEEALGQAAELLGLCPLRDPHLPGIAQALSQGQRWAGECLQTGAQGRQVDTWLSVSTLRNDSGRVSHHIRVLTDISVLKAQQRELAQQARKDSLTGLANRREFAERLSQAMARACRYPHTLAVMYLDLDGFKAINDRLGHAAGDQLLIEVAHRLQACVRTTDLVCRLAGDEFTVVLEGAGHPDEVCRIAQRILDRLAQPCDLGGQRTPIGASLGAALFRKDETQGALCHRADAAMYRAKRQGKGRFVLDGHDDSLAEAAPLASPRPWIAHPRSA